jgi:hypothetical protein
MFKPEVRIRRERIEKEDKMADEQGIRASADESRLKVD